MIRFLNEEEIKDRCRENGLTLKGQLLYFEAEGDSFEGEGSGESRRWEVERILSDGFFFVNLEPGTTAESG